MKHRLRRRYGHSATAGAKVHVTGKLFHVDATRGTVSIEADDGKHWGAQLMSATYWKSGSSSQAYQAALRVKKLLGRRVTAELEYHPAFGWAIFGGSKIRLAKGGD